MEVLEVVLIAIGLAMDAFAVSICKGLAMKKMCWKKAVIIGLYFGIFQGLMPVIGYFLGSTFESLVTKIDHWIAFVLLVFIGLNMLKEALGKDSENCSDCVDFKTMSILAIATSIDALAVGIAFAVCVIGVKIGNEFGDKYEKKLKLLAD